MAAAEKPRRRSGVFGMKRVEGGLSEALAAEVDALRMPQKAGDAAVDAIQNVCNWRDVRVSLALESVGVRVEERESYG